MTASTYIALRVFAGSHLWFPWLIIVGAQIPVAVAWSVLVKSVDWYVQKRRMEADRQQAEIRIREQAALLDKAQDAIFVVGLDWQLTYWNKSAENLLGWTSEEMLQLRQENPFLKSQLSQLETARQHAHKNSEWHGEMSLTTREGRPIVVQSRWTLVRDVSEVTKSYLVINTDITEQKKAHVRIQEQAALLDKAQDAIFVQNLEGKTTYLNQSAAKLYGWTTEEILNQDAFGKVLPPRDANVPRGQNCGHPKW